MSWYKLLFNVSFRAAERTRTSLLSVDQNQCVRWLRYTPFLSATEGEKRLTEILKEKLKPSFVEVRDISGGCGSMYEIHIDSVLFKEKRLIQQHRLVNEALGDEVKLLHGLTIKIGNPNTDER